MVFKLLAHVRPQLHFFRPISLIPKVSPQFLRYKSGDMSVGVRHKSGRSDPVADEVVSQKTRVFRLPVYLEKNEIDFISDEKHRFRHGISDFHAERLTVREVEMLKFMNAVTDKPNWHKKVFDEEIVHRWREEARAMPNSMISDKTFEWCITELRDRSKDFERDGYVRTLECSARCIKSDELISAALRDELRQAVKPLLEVSDCQKDWHPGSDEKVLNLVHPSLYSLVGGRSRILETGEMSLDDCMEYVGKGTLIEPGEEIPSHKQGHGLTDRYNQDKLCSTRFQWLPAEVRFMSDAGTDVKITSYINNLHPGKHQNLYRVIEALIGKSIPLWNNVLVKGWHGRASPRIRTYGASVDAPEPAWFEDIWANEADLMPLVPKIQEYLAQPDNPLYADRREARWCKLAPNPKKWAADEAFEAVREVYERIRTIVHPEPGVSFSYEQWKAGDTGNGVVPAPRHNWTGPALDSYTIQLEEEFRERGLQVIVKLSSIELTPDKPNYEGGNWHLEGMLNESIVATSIFYYDVHNVTESQIRFSQEHSVEADFEYEQEDHEPLAITFGTRSMRDEPGDQEIGSINARHGRIISFPNTLRHKVEPFRLADKSVPGHRRFLVLWLVDPYHRIASTADVPPQQLSWAEDAGLDKDIQKSLMTLDEAKAYRLELMKERTMLNDAVEGNFDTYNLCEH